MLEALESLGAAVATADTRTGHRLPLECSSVMLLSLVQHFAESLTQSRKPCGDLMSNPDSVCNGAVQFNLLTTQSFSISNLFPLN